MRTLRHLLPIALLLGCTETQLVPAEPVAHLDPGTDSLVMSPGETLHVTVVPRDLAGNELYDRVIGFASSAPSIATIDSQGTLAGVAVGNTRIRLSSEDAVDSVPVRVVTSWVGGGFGDVDGPECLLRPGRRAWCWGYAQGSGGVPTPRASTVAFRSVSGGYYHICGVASDSTGWCWGYNQRGEILGLIGHDQTPEPVQQLPGTTFVSLTAGYEHTCGVTTAGAGLCWGRNFDGQLGDSTNVARTIAVAVYGGHSWREIGSGDSWSCGLDSSDQTWCWGIDWTSTSPYAVDDLIPVLHPGVPSFASLSVGGDFACGLTAAGAAWCWGANDEGELGHPGQAAAPVATAATFVQLALGYNEACGLDASGVAWCWGHGGWTGDGTWEAHQEPTPVLGGHRFVSLASGWPGFCGFTAGGAAWCWGSFRLWNSQALVPRRVWDP